MRIKYLCVTFLIFALLKIAFAEQIELEGVIEHKPWTKTYESFIAGGSDHYVLNQGLKIVKIEDLNGNVNEKNHPDNIILKPTEKVGVDIFARYEGKNVTIKGEFLNEERKVGEFDQRPLHEGIFDPETKTFSLEIPENYVLKVYMIEEKSE